MPLPPLLQRRPADIADPPTADAAEQQARTRARRRLIGAAVLLVVGVLAFPVLFETQPRPVPVDIPMTIPSKDAAAPLTLPPRAPKRAKSGAVDAPVAAAAPTGPAAAPAPAPVPAAAVPAAASVAASPAPVAASAVVAPPKPAAPAPAPAVAAVVPAERKPAPPPERKPEAKPAEAKPAPKVEAKAEAKPAADTKTQRFVIQVGAFGDDASAREARQKVERLGMKTYVQDVDVQGARRIRVRVGPFDNLAEANKALAALKAAKLPGAVLTL